MDPRLALRTFIFWTVWICVPMKEITKEFSCCELPQININLSHINEFSIANKSLVIVRNSTFQVRRPFVQEGRKIILDTCKDFDQKIVYDEDNFTNEEIIHYKSQPCNDQSATIITGCVIGLGLLLLAVVVGLIVWCCKKRSTNSVV